MKTRGIVLACSAVLAGSASGGTRVNAEIGARLQRVRIAAAYAHTCVVLEDGTVRCWGDNRDGQLGNGAVAAVVDSPVQVANLFAVTSVAVGQAHSCALTKFGIVQCWGDNSRGALGTGNRTPSTTPVSAGIDGVVAIAAGGGQHTCALRVDGSVWCWGDNDSHQTGSSGTADVLTPTQVSLPHGPAVAIAAGFLHTCALAIDGTVQCWGHNFFGELGADTPGNAPQSIPISVPLSGVVDIVSSYSHTCAILSSGSAACWGEDSLGQLGDGSKTVSLPPQAINVSNIVSMTVGSAHSCALLANGTVTCWGDNSLGQLGDGTNNPHLTPGTMVAGLTNAIALSSTSISTCALTAAGAVRCWGSNGQGELGNGTTSPSPTPSTVTGINGSIGALGVAVGGLFTCARRGNGTASCWGTGVLGNGSTSTTSSSNAVNAGNLSNVIALAAGDRHACALTASGTASCWGDNGFGQIGSGSSQSYYSTPNPVVETLTNVIGLAAGGAHTCALISDGTVRCWGDNSAGEVGSGSLTKLLTPVAVKSLTGVIQVAAGTDHTCALLFDHTVRCWGYNVRDQLGDGGAESSSTVPVRVLGLNDAVAISAGESHTCALSASGAVHCWGYNIVGQLGIGNTDSRAVPDTVTGLIDAVSIAAGAVNTCAVRAEGSAVCWGGNQDDQLGASDTANHPTPTPVIQSFTTVKGITIPAKLPFIVAVAPSSGSTTHSHTCALLASGQPDCWGDNQFAEIGDGTAVTPQPRPSIVNSFTANVDPDVTVRFNGRIATVTALVNCPSGGIAHLYLTVEQDFVSGYGTAISKCEEGLVEVPMTVPAFGPRGFENGPATARVEMIVRENRGITQDQRWIRDVVIASESRRPRLR